MKNTDNNNKKARYELHLIQNLILRKSKKNHIENQISLVVIGILTFIVMFFSQNKAKTRLNVNKHAQKL